MQQQQLRTDVTNASQRTSKIGEYNNVANTTFNTTSIPLTKFLIILNATSVAYSPALRTLPPVTSSSTPRLTCQDRNHQRMVITVHTAIKNRKRRGATRNSWGSAKNLRRYNASLYFFIGQPKYNVVKMHKLIDGENAQFADLIKM